MGEDKEIESIGHHILNVTLMSGTYLGGFEIATKDGSSLRQTIRDTLGEHPKVIAIARSCP